MSEKYMLTHDIDWFCCINHQYLVHLASNGSLLPEFVANTEVLKRAQQIVMELPFSSIGELHYNESHINELRKLEGFEKDRYMQSFSYFAQKGFYSMDYEWESEGEGGYRFIVGPSNRRYPPIDYVNDIPQIDIDKLDGRDRELFTRIIIEINRNN